MNRAGSFRGNSALDGAFDTIVQLDRKKDSEQVTVSCDKQKDAEEFDKFIMRRKHVELTTGVRSMVLVVDATANPYVDGVIKMLDGAGPRGMTHKDAEQAAEDSGLCKHAAFNEAWTLLKKEGMIELAEDSPVKYNARWVRNMVLLDLTA